MATAFVAGGLVLLTLPQSNASFTATRTNGANSLASGSLPAPTPVSCAWTGSNSLSFSWTNTSSLADGYKVERSDSLGSGYATLATVTPASTVTTNDTNPLPPTLRYYRVNSYAGSFWTSSSTTGLASNACDLSIVAVASINDPTGLAIDASGNVYTSSSADNKVYKTTTGGTTTTFAGTGVSGYSGDGGAATSAQLGGPKDLAIDGSGNLYFAEQANGTVRKVTPGGTISTVAGTGIPGYSGDGGAATAAKLNNPYGVNVLSDGTIYIGDAGNNVIRKITPGGTISTVAGTGVSGYLGDGGAATAARLSFPYDTVVDSSGNLIISDTNNNVLRKVTPGGTISTLAGGGATTTCNASGTATSFSFLQPKRLAYDSTGNRIFLPDSGRNCIRVITGANLAPLAGNGTASTTGDNGPAIAATVNGPTVAALSTAGDLYVGDGSGTVRKVLQV